MMLKLAMNTTYSKHVTVKNREGIHARPSVKIVELTNRFKSELTITKGELTVDSKSILDVLTLAASYGSELEIKATGEDAREAVDALCKLLSTEFHFPET